MREEAGRPPGEEDVHDLRDMRDLMLDTFRSQGFQRTEFRSLRSGWRVLVSFSKF